MGPFVRLPLPLPLPLPMLLPLEARTTVLFKGMADSAQLLTYDARSRLSQSLVRATSRVSIVASPFARGPILVTRSKACRVELRSPEYLMPSFSLLVLVRVRV